MKVSLPSQTKLTPEEEVLKIDVFWEEFSYLDIERFEQGYNEVMTTCKWFPSPAEFKEIMSTTYNQPGSSDLPRFEYQPLDRDYKVLPTDTAKELLRQLWDRWDREDIRVEKDIIKKREKRKEELHKQAKSILQAEKVSPKSED